MAVDYLRDVKPFEDAGLTDAQIASHLSNRTAKPIPCGEAKVLLEESGLVVEDPVTLQRSGTLVARYNSMPNEQLKSLLGWFIAHVFGRGEQISSHENPRAVQLAAVLADLPAEMQAVGDALLQLGGGQPQAGTTEQDVADARSAYAAVIADQERQNAIDALRAEIENTWINPAMADGVSVAADVRSAIKAGL